MLPAAAIFPDQERATETRRPSIASGATPRDDRRELVSERKRASSEPVSAWAARGAFIPSAITVATSANAARTRFDIAHSPLALALVPGGAPPPALPARPRHGLAR